jgi:CSLREA domain-containing protein
VDIRITRRCGGLLAAVVVALACSAASATAGAKTYQVRQHADPAPNGCTKHDCSLREAISAANAHPGADVVGLRGGNYKLTRKNKGGVGDNDNERGDLDVTDPVTIEHIGKGRSKLDANGLDRILQVVGPGNPTKLLKLKLIGGKNPAPEPTKRIIVPTGGGILSYESPLTLIKCAVIGNAAKGGGGIEAEAGLTMKQGVVTNNSATTGAGGGIDAIHGTVNIALSTISHNKSAGSGAGVAIDAGTLHLQKSTLSANTAGTSGGGVFLYNSPPSTIDTSTLNNNVARGASGGGLELEFSTLGATDSTIAANQSATDGGGIYSSNSTVTANGLTVAKNRADRDTNGSGVDGGVAVALGTFHLENSIMGKNRAGNDYDDCGGTFASGGGNVVMKPSDCGGFVGLDTLNKDPKLEKLDTNGGPTRTMGLKQSSPAIGAAVKATSTSHDQRGEKRDKHPDSGAFER